MGEVAEMMLDGTLCEACGVFIGSDAGFPQYCSKQCAEDRGAEWHGKPQRSKNWKQRTQAEIDDENMDKLEAAFDSYINCAAKRKVDPAHLVAMTVAALADNVEMTEPQFRELFEIGLKLSFTFGSFTEKPPEAA